MAAHVPDLALVAEFNPIQARWASAALEHLGYRVETFGSGRAALDRYSQVADCVAIVAVSDDLPEVSGLELASRLLGARPGLPVLVMTARAWLPDPKLPSVRRLVRPVSHLEFEEAVRELTERAVAG